MFLAAIFPKTDDQIFYPSNQGGRQEHSSLIAVLIILYLGLIVQFKYK